MVGEAEKKLRTSAKRKFTRAYNRFTEAIENKIEVDIVTAKYSDIKILWNDVQSIHEDYLFAAFPEEDDPMDQAEEAWLSDIEEKFEIVQKMRYDYERLYKIRNEESNMIEKEKTLSHQSTRENQLAKQKVEMEKKMFMQEKENIDRMLEEDRNGFLKVQIGASLKDLKHQLERCNEAHLKVISTSKVVEDESWINDLYLLYDEINQKSLRYFKCICKFEAERNKKKDSIRLERMKMPTFSGDVRSYGRFKSDFTRQVEPNIEKENLAYTLKSCLSKEVLRIVESVDDKVEEMWERLDHKFGRPSLLVDTIMNDIKKMQRVSEGNDNGLLVLVDVIERGYMNLKRLGIEKEMSNSITLSMIEEKLPGSIRREWSKEVNKAESKVDPFNKFPDFLKFLLEQKRILEYEMAGLRLDSEENHGTVYYDGTINRRNGNRCVWHKSNGHKTEDCWNYKALEAREKVNIINENKCCSSCLKGGHRGNECRNKKKCGVDGCDNYHHTSLHKAHAAGITFHASVVNSEEREQQGSVCLLQIMKIFSGDNAMSVLWDSGASISLITFRMANILGLKGSKTSLNVVKIGGEVENLSSFKYTLPLYDKSHNVTNIQVYGIEKISNIVKSSVTDELIQKFRSLKKNEVQADTVEIDVLIGFNYAPLYPVKEQSAGNLLLMRNKFGRCLAGSHATFKDNNSLIVHSVTVHHMMVKEDDFLNIESMGVRCNPSPNCGSCRCGKCALGGKNYTIKEEREQRLIEEGLTFQNGHWLAAYPWTRDPKELPKNKMAALRMLQSTEKRLLKNAEHAKMYAQQIEDMLNRDVARKLTIEELRNYNGPIYYLSHHDVMKAESSTPCRIVFNSSLKFQGHVLNEYWAKGPNLLNNLIGILLRFREENVAITGDIKKMYHAVKIGLLEQHTHRFLWREYDTERTPDTYVMTSVSFGDKPAANIAITALRKTAEMGKDEYPEAAEVVIKNTYMDDIIDSFDSHEKAVEITSNIDKIIRDGNFKVKKWIISSKDSMPINEEKVKGFSEDAKQKVLGLVWDRMSDSLRYDVKLNFSEKKRGIYVGPDIKRNDIHTNIPEIITKRMILSKVNSIYDPLGLISPFTVTAKIILKDLWKKGLDWDENVGEPERGDIKKFLTTMFNMEDVSFSRCTKPEGAIGNPILVTFCDASNDAFGACSYLRWGMGDGSFKSVLISAKSRVSPVKVLTIVRLELCAAVLGTRLANLVKTEMRFQMEQTIFLVDSQIVQSMIKKESYGFNTFVAVRIGEIQVSSNVDSWYWIDSNTNIADWISRGKKPEELGRDSLWQNGPEFMKNPIEKWPTRRSVCTGILPEEKNMVTIATLQTNSTISRDININLYSRYRKLIQVTARLLQVFQKMPCPSLKNIFQFPTVEMINMAELCWIKDAQGLVIKGIQRGDYRRLCPRKSNDDIYIVGGRMEKWFENSYNTQGLILLPHNHRISYLYAMWIHNLDHLGVAATVSKIRNKFWITQLQRIVTSIRNKCVTCRKLNKKLQEQVMSQLPLSRLKPAPAFQNTFIDLFGPFEIRGVVNKRTRGKCFGVIYTCGNSRAVYCDLSPDYSTDGFLQTTRRFVSLRGFPANIFSDCGSQLVAANKEIQSIIKDLDTEKIKEFGAAQGLSWHFTSPDAPWQNGCAEALVKSVKKAITVAIGDQVLSFPELQTVLFEASNIVNERPIGVTNRNIDDGKYICPNDLLLGRASSRVPGGPFKQYTSIRKRHEFVQSIATSFWKQWIRDFFPSLLIRQKWHINKRNLCIGDIVLIQDKNALRGSWKLGKVVRVHVSANDGIIRNVDVQYKINQDRSFTTVRRAVQSLVLLLPVEEDLDN